MQEIENKNRFWFSYCLKARSAASAALNTLHCPHHLYLGSLHHHLLLLLPHLQPPPAPPAAFGRPSTLHATKKGNQILKRVVFYCHWNASRSAYRCLRHSKPSSPHVNSPGSTRGPSPTLWHPPQLVLLLCPAHAPIWHHSRWNNSVTASNLSASEEPQDGITLRHSILASLPVLTGVPCGALKPISTPAFHLTRISQRYYRHWWGLFCLFSF